MPGSGQGSNDSVTKLDAQEPWSQTVCLPKAKTVNRGLDYPECEMRCVDDWVSEQRMELSSCARVEAWLHASSWPAWDWLAVVRLHAVFNWLIWVCGQKATVGSSLSIIISNQNQTSRSSSLLVCFSDCWIHCLIAFSALMWYLVTVGKETLGEWVLKVTGPAAPSLA